LDKILIKLNKKLELSRRHWRLRGERAQWINKNASSLRRHLMKRYTSSMSSLAKNQKMIGKWLFLNPKLKRKETRVLQMRGLFVNYRPFSMRN
jgi:hypothetical protein